MRERKKASYTHAIFFQLMIIYFALCKVEKKTFFYVVEQQQNSFQTNAK